MWRTKAKSKTLLIQKIITVQCSHLKLNCSYAINKHLARFEFHKVFRPSFFVYNYFLFLQLFRVSQKQLLTKLTMTYSSDPNNSVVTTKDPPSVCFDLLTLALRSTTNPTEDFVTAPGCLGGVRGRNKISNFLRGHSLKRIFRLVFLFTQQLFKKGKKSQIQTQSRHTDSCHCAFNDFTEFLAAYGLEFIELYMV